MASLTNLLAKINGSVKEVKGLTTTLLHFDGLNNSQDIIDSSLVGNTWRAFNNAQIDTSQSVFGGASCSFDGVTDFIDGNGDGGMAFGTRDFTFHCRFRLRSVGAARSIIDTRADGVISGPFISIEILSGNTLILFVNGATQITGATVLVANQWYHLALTRSGTNTRMFLDSVQQGLTWTTDTTNYLVGADRPRIGAQGDAGGLSPGRSLNGWIDELHCIDGRALWTTAGFTLPVAAYDMHDNIELVNETAFEIAVNHTFEDGDLLTQADVTVVREYVLAPAGSVSIDFTDLDSLFGEIQDTDIRQLKLIMIKAGNNDGDIRVGGGGSFAGPFGSVAHGVRVRPGGMFLISDLLGGGWLVVGGSNDVLLVTNDASNQIASFTAVFVGVS